MTIFINRTIHFELMAPASYFYLRSHGSTVASQHPGGRLVTLPSLVHRARRCAAGGAAGGAATAR